MRTKDDRRLESYVSGVLDGSIPSCRMVVLAVERWMKDLERQELVYDPAIFNKFCSFSRPFKHYKGAMAGEYFEPEPWQLFIAANCLALKWRITGRRKYRLADVYLPRKNGKTMFGAIIMLWILLMDGEGGPEVYTAALDKDQARLSYDAMATLVQESIFAPMRQAASITAPTRRSPRESTASR